MDPLSTSASLLAVLTACIQTTKSLSSAVKRYRGRDKTLNRLSHGLQDLIQVLELLEKIKVAEGITIMLIEGPVSRCKQICEEFESAMEKFNMKHKLGFLDWAKMEFMTSDINDFMDTIATYKSTIAIGLGILNMQTSKINQQVLEEYKEMIQDTTYDLNLRLQRVDGKLNPKEQGNITNGNTTINLKDEKDITENCLRICEEASAYIKSVQEKEAPSLRQGELMATRFKDQFEAQVVTSRTLEANSNELLKTTKILQERLNTMINDSSNEHDQISSRLLKDIEVTKRCLDVCDQASEQVNHVKIHTIGPVVAENNTDQVVVTTLADLFNVERVEAKSGSAQLVGSMQDESLKQLSKDRYNSRFATIDGYAELIQTPHSPSPTAQISRPSHHTQVADRSADQKKDAERPSANQMKRRTTGADPVE